MKVKKSQQQLGPITARKEVLSNFANINIKADWLIASAIDDIYNLEDGE